jgi:hypothetical protein
VVSNQYLFDNTTPLADLGGLTQFQYIQSHFIYTDHCQFFTGSAGLSYLWNGTRFSADMFYGSGLRSGDANIGQQQPYTQFNVGMTHEFQGWNMKPLTLRFDVVNVFDTLYQDQERNRHRRIRAAIRAAARLFRWAVAEILMEYRRRSGNQDPLWDFGSSRCIGPKLNFETVLRLTATHLLHEKEAGLIIAPIAVIKVAGDDDEVDLILNRQAHQIVERHPGGCPYPFGGGALLPGKPLQGAIKMNVAGVNETKRNSFDANHEATPGGVIGSPVRPTPGDRNRRGNPESRSRNFLRVAVIEHKWNAICASRTFPVLCSKRTKTKPQQ